ncbi:hypothetical protein LIT32_07265 [Bacillus sp. CMF21]|nr:hypothetical protein LIT32_07265 [Bacillus sp. CMF21]
MNPGQFLTLLKSSPEVQLPFTVATLTGKDSVLGRKENRVRPATNFYVYGQDYLNEFKSNRGQTYQGFVLFTLTIDKDYG